MSTKEEIRQELLDEKRRIDKEGFEREYNSGWEVRVSRFPDFRGYSFKYFVDKKEAQRYADSLKNKGGYYRIIPNDNIEVCKKCGRLYDDTEECLFCEKIEYDSRMDERYEAEQEERSKEDEDEE